MNSVDKHEHKIPGENIRHTDEHRRPDDDE